MTSRTSLGLTLLVLLAIAGMVAAIAVANDAGEVRHNAPRDRESTTDAPIDTLIRAMVLDSMLMEKSVGYAGEEPEQWRRYQRLCTLATDEQLLRLVEHGHPVVRCYAFRALARRNHPDVFDVLLRHIDDLDSVNTFSGCRFGPEIIADEHIGAVSRRHTSFAGGFVPDRAQQATLDSTLLYRPGLTLMARAWLLEDLEPDPRHYDRIRRIHVEDPASNAIVALARYRRTEDIPTILDAVRVEDGVLPYDALSAIREFPDRAFYPTLVELFSTMVDSGDVHAYPLSRLTVALAAYPTARTVELFRTALAHRDTERRAQIAQAIALTIRLHRHPLFDALERSIVLDEMAEREVAWDIESAKRRGPTRPD